MHEVLYRKYRPKNFNEVLGQESVVRVLEGAIRAGHVGHAYLFAGSRGTGKTSVARIFAKEMGTSEKDLYEIDAASNRGIDDIRELREAVTTLPFESARKVYLIDEVHMLTKDAWNALLKTIEEPPAHVVFILATTELPKVPETIQSRCQIFRFNRPSREIVRTALLSVARAEGYTLAPPAAALVASAAEGSFRDAFGVLEKVIAASTDNALGEREVEVAIGAPPLGVVRAFIEALAKADIAHALLLLETSAARGVDMAFFLSLVLTRVRAVLLLRYAPAYLETVRAELGDEEAELLLRYGAEQGITRALLASLLDADMQIRHASIPALPIELALFHVLEKKEEKRTA